MMTDQLTKAAVRKRAQQSVIPKRPVTSFDALLWILLVVALVLAIRSGHFFQSVAAQIGVGAAVGGAASNLYERFRHGGITDFIRIGWWPVFNIADLAITLGAIVAIWFIR